MHEKYNTLYYDGYLYKICGCAYEQAVRLLLGDIPPASPFSEELTLVDVRYAVRDSGLYLTFLRTYVSAEFSAAVRERCGEDLRTEPCKELGVGGFKACELLFENMEIPVPLDGDLLCHQYYVDEEEWGEKIHSEVSTFAFEKGILNTERSSIQKSDERYIDALTWRSERMSENPDADGLGITAAGVRWFFVDPVGNCSQNNHLLSVHVNYCRTGVVDPVWMEEILACSEPVLRLEMMCESKSGSNDYRLRVCDLVLDFVRELDAENLALVYDRIPFDRYANYSRTMLEALLTESVLFTEKCRVWDLENGIAVLELLAEKGFACDSAAEYASRLSAETADRKGGSADGSETHLLKKRIVELLKALA